MFLIGLHTIDLLAITTMYIDRLKSGLYLFYLYDLADIQIDISFILVPRIDPLSDSKGNGVIIRI